jgi:hypothetical protein
LTQPPPKKSGGRDISALKERLRPKTGANPTAGGAPRTASPTGGQVLPPPGLDIPPPPGHASQPAAHAVPDASTDPFGHMNAMAQMGAAQRAPEIVIVHDGKPVETVATHHRIATVGKIVAIALVPLVIGIAIRGISKDAHAFNSGITGAKVVNTEVQALKKELGKLEDEIAATQKKDVGGREITAALKKFGGLEIDPGRVFRAKQTNIGAQLSSQVIEFYAGVELLQQMIKDHVRLATNDDAALGTALAATKALTLPKEQQLATQLRYAVMVWNPAPGEAGSDTAPPGARIVEVGPPYCGGDEAPTMTGTCPAEKPPTAVSIRYAPGGTWIKGDFAALGGGDAIASRKVLTISPNPIFEALALTPEGAAAELTYRKRLQNILEKVGEVKKLANDIEKPLLDKSRETPRFTFFM